MLDIIGRSRCNALQRAMQEAPRHEDDSPGTVPRVLGPGFWQQVAINLLLTDRKHARCGGRPKSWSSADNSRARITSTSGQVGVRIDRSGEPQVRPFKHHEEWRHGIGFRSAVFRRAHRDESAVPMTVSTLHFKGDVPCRNAQLSYSWWMRASCENAGRIIRSAGGGRRASAGVPETPTRAVTSCWQDVGCPI